MNRNKLNALAIIAALVCPQIANAQTTIRIGVLTDMSGLYSDFSGAGSLEAAKMAAEDFMAANPDVKVEVVSADHQNKPDIAASIARKWLENDGVDAIADVATSSASLAVSHIAKDKNKVFLATNAATTDLTGKQCSPNTVHWTFDTWGFAHGTGEYLVKQGKKRWFFLTADYVYGHTVEREASEVVKAAGGTVVGSVKHPLNTPDFSSFLLQAQASKAEIIALANSGGDTINAIKQAAEFGMAGGRQELAAMAIFLSDVHSLGLETAQGLKLTTWFYWDLNDTTRAFAKRFAARRNGQYPVDGTGGDLCRQPSVSQGREEGRKRYRRSQRRRDHARLRRMMTHYLAGLRFAPTDARPIRSISPKSKSRPSPRGRTTTTRSSRPFRRSNQRALSPRAGLPAASWRSRGGPSPHDQQRKTVWGSAQEERQHGGI